MQGNITVVQFNGANYLLDPPIFYNAVQWTRVGKSAHLPLQCSTSHCNAINCNKLHTIAFQLCNRAN